MAEAVLFINWIVFQSAPGREAGRHTDSNSFITYCTSFNPRPAVRPGDTRAFGDKPCEDRRFNPRPAVRPGDTSTIAPSCTSRTSFNPRPAVRPGDTRFQVGESLKANVSIRARP